MSVDDPRDRLIQRFNRARLGREVRRGASPAIVVVVSFVIALLGVGYMVSKIAPTLLNPSYEVKFAVDDAAGVVANVNPVRFKGVRVGSVVKVDFQHDKPVLTLKIRKKYGRIYRNAHAQLRPNTALQDMFVDIVDRGTPAAHRLEPDDTLPATQTETPVSISEVLDIFAPSVRLRLRTLLDDLGNGMADRGRSLRGVFVEMAPLIHNAGEIADQLARRGPLVRRLVHNSSLLTRALADRESQLRTVLTDGGATVRELQAGSRDLDATLHELPPTVASIQTSFARLRGALGDVDGAARSLYPVAAHLPTALSAIRRLALAASPAIRALRPPVGDLLPLARTLRPVSAQLALATSALVPQVPAIEKTTHDLEICKQGVQNFFQWNASISKFGDSRGPIPRGNVVLGAQSSSVFNDPNEIAPQACSPGKVIGGRPATAKDLH